VRLVRVTVFRIPSLKRKRAAPTRGSPRRRGRPTAFSALLTASHARARVCHTTGVAIPNAVPSEAGPRYAITSSCTETAFAPFHTWYSPARNVRIAHPTSYATSARGIGFPPPRDSRGPRS
jgi:hypothetical protein